MPERAFERKVLLSKLALLFEKIWPRAWILLGIAGLFILVSLAGLWPRLPELPHKIVLGLFGLAFAAAVIALLSVRWPTREEAIRRVESVSGVRHRPASSYEDTLSHGGEDARTAALWKVHRQRLAESLARLRVGAPAPRTDRRDPFALRALLLLCVLLLTVVVGDSAADRLWSAFRLSPLAKGAEARLDAWITPPAYTGKPPIMLADGGLSLAAPQETRPAGAMEVPDRSTLIVRAGGAGMRGLVLEVPGEGGAPQRLEAPAPANPAEVAELKLEVRDSGTMRASSGGTQVARLDVHGHSRPHAQDRADQAAGALARAAASRCSTRSRTTTASSPPRPASGASWRSPIPPRRPGRGPPRRARGCPTSARRCWR